MLYVYTLCMYIHIGEEAVKAKNTFYYLTYNGSIDLDTATDPNMRKVIIHFLTNVMYRVDCLSVVSRVLKIKFVILARHHTSSSLTHTLKEILQ